MRYLLDTCTAVWYFEGNRRIGSELQAVLTDPGHELFLSDVSILEIVIKNQSGKFPMPKPPSKILPHLIKKYSLRQLPIAQEAIFQLEKLPLLHRDPFDRLLVAHAISFRLTLVTPDPLVRQYPSHSIWID